MHEFRCYDNIAPNPKCQRVLVPAKPRLFVPRNIRHQQRLFMRPFVLRLLPVFVVLLLVFGRPFVKRFALCYRTVVCLSCPVRNVGVLWPNGCTDPDETWHEGRPRPRRLCVRWVPSSSPQKGTQPSNFRPMSVVAKRLDGSRWHLAWRWASLQATLCYMGTQLPYPKREAEALPVVGHFYCGKMAGCINMPLGIEVGLGQGHIVLDGNPDTTKGRTPNFAPISIMTKQLYASG